MNTCGMNPVLPVTEVAEQRNKRRGHLEIEVRCPTSPHARTAHPGECDAEQGRHDLDVQ